MGQVWWMMRQTKLRKVDRARRLLRQGHFLVSMIIRICSQATASIFSSLKRKRLYKIVRLLRIMLSLLMETIRL